jgi:hypothetical protein
MLDLNPHITRTLTAWRTLPHFRLRWRIEFKAADLWIGAFWTQHEAWLCLLPCLPLHLQRIRGQCEHKGCKARGEPCYFDEGSEYFGEPGIYLCREHLAEHCFCLRCGQFYGGIEASHFIHPGLCDGCGMLSGEERRWECFDEDEDE